MQLFLLTGAIMIAFASNSVLNRIGVGLLGMDALAFATVRTMAGAAMLCALVLGRGQGPRLGWPGRSRMCGAVALATYMIGFSVAYRSVDAGLGALILFGVLQVVVFGWAVWTRQTVPPLRWAGAGIAFAGLCILLWPAGQMAVSLAGTVAMVLAGVAWAAYTLLGRNEADALGATAGNFLLCLPLTAVALLLSGGGAWPVAGVVTAVAAGAITSGLGYALWYRVLPQLAPTMAAIAQLSVPVIAVVAGVVLLAEPLTLRLMIAGALVLGGIATSVLAGR